MFINLTFFCYQKSVVTSTSKWDGVTDYYKDFQVKVSDKYINQCTSLLEQEFLKVGTPRK